MRTTVSSFFALACLSYGTFFLGFGCSPAPAPVSSSPSDPSNPKAAEGTTPTVVASATTPTPTSYVCPMHPEVTSHDPGECPKCHMKLVPKK